jgi:hypothetical protein
MSNLKKEEKQCNSAQELAKNVVLAHSSSIPCSASAVKGILFIFFKLLYIYYR